MDYSDLIFINLMFVLIFFIVQIGTELVMPDFIEKTIH
jgi:hypothetical protein